MNSEAVTYSEFSNALSNPVLLGIVNFAPLKGNIILEMASNLGYAIVDRMLGGRGDPMDKVREFSEIELLIIERIMIVCVNLLREPWENVAVSSVSISSKIKEKWAAIVVTVIGTVAAIVYPMDNITNFLYLIGSVFAPMIAVQIADYFILKKADAEESAFQWRNLVVWLVGFVLYRVLMHVDTPVVNTLPDMVITVIVCVIVEKIAAAVKEK